MYFSEDEGYFLPFYLSYLANSAKFFGVFILWNDFGNIKVLFIQTMVLLTWTGRTAFSVYTNLIVTGEHRTNHLMANNVTILKRKKM